MQIFLPAKKEEGKLFFLPLLLVKPNKQILSRIQRAPWLSEDSIAALKPQSVYLRFSWPLKQLHKNSVPSAALTNWKYFLPIEETGTP